MANAGFVKIYRQILDWEWYSDLYVRVVFMHCLLRANHAPCNWKGVQLKVGQFITSYAHLAKECSLSVQKTRTALNKLKITGELTYKSTSQYSIITINNWNKWQANDMQINKQVTNEQQTSNNRQEYKELKKERNKENNVFFEIFENLCKNLIPLSSESKNKQIIAELNDFLEETDYDKSYFENLCKKADSLKKIVNRKIDFRSMLRNHIGIMNGKYEDNQPETLNVKKFFEAYRAGKESKNA